MPQRRMFSYRIANSARFLQMPFEAQLLYFHMVLRADDDGVVESYPLMRLLGLATDNFKILLAKGFIKQLNEDQVIVIIDWLEHNTIRADRKVDSIYKDLLLNNIPNIKLIEAKPRSDVEDNTRRIGGPSTDSPWSAEVKLSKVKLSKKEIYKESFNFSWLEELSIQGDEVKELAEKYSISCKDVMKKAEDISLYCTGNGKKYHNYRSVLMNWIRRDLESGKLRRIEKTKPFIPPENPVAIPEEIRLQMKNIIKKMEYK